jgi:hypothetical protein
VAQGLAELDLGANDGQQAGIVPGLLDEVAGAAPHRLNRQLYAPPSGHDHHGEGRVHLLNPGEKIKPFLPRGGVAGVVQVHQDGVEVPHFQGIDDAGGRANGFGLEALALQQQAE